MENAINGKQKDSVREETSVVSGTTEMSVQNRHPKPIHPLRHTQRGRIASRKKNLRSRSPSGKTNRQPCNNFLKGTCTELPCDYWHPPECQIYKSESGCKLGTECSFLCWKVEEQPDKSGVAVLKMYDSWVAYFRTQSRRNLCQFLRKSTSLGINSTSTVH